jgi:RNA polymerase sigma-70 factor, ECF subfamily
MVSRRRPEPSPVAAVDVDDAPLVELARQGDGDAFQTLFERHRTMLTSIVRRASGGSRLVEDIVQETALSALIGIDRLKQPDRFGAWLVGIGLNICRRYRRQELERPSSLTQAVSSRADPAADPSEVAIEREISRSVRTAIKQLPSGQREAAALYYLSGLTYRETAIALGIGVGAVRTRLHRARARLGEELSSVWKGEGMEPTEGREMVPVRVADVLRLQPTEGKQPQFVVMLEESGGGTRRLPIWVCEPEATWLAYGIEQIELPRPGPYSMLAALLEATSARIREVRIERLVEWTYFATVLAEGKASATIDARPSDALNLAVLTGAQVFVASELLDAAALGSAQYDRLDAQLTDGTTVGARTIGSEAMIASQRSLEELIGDE